MSAWLCAGSLTANGHFHVTAALSLFASFSSLASFLRFVSLVVGLRGKSLDKCLVRCYFDFMPFFIIPEGVLSFVVCVSNKEV